jgi:hypothetical protein
MRGTQTKVKTGRRRLVPGCLPACSPFPPLVATPSTGMMAINHLPGRGWSWGLFALTQETHAPQRDPPSSSSSGDACKASPTSSRAGRRRSRHSGTPPDPMQASRRTPVASPRSSVPQTQVWNATHTHISNARSERCASPPCNIPAPRKAKIGFESLHVYEVPTLATRNPPGNQVLAQCSSAWRRPQGPGNGAY